MLDDRPPVRPRPRPALRIAIIGNHPPRRCGIATYTRDVAASLRAMGHKVHLTAMVDAGQSYDFAGAVDRTVAQESRAAHATAGAAITAWRPDVVLVQHEFGIYGGPAGCWVLDLLDAVDAPVVVQLHTVLETPDADQARVMAGLRSRASRLIVMARRGHAILERPASGGPEIDVIAHGVPDRPRVPSRVMRARLGWPERPTMMTFGLLSPGKGIEMAINSLPAIRACLPDIRYVLLGATHPVLIAHEGERYRDGLLDRARSLGVADALDMENRYVDDDDLCDLLQAADLYVTPYASEAQITSGTLAYALACGVPTLSTPYWHAQEVLDPEFLISFGDAGALAAAAIPLLSDTIWHDGVADALWRAQRGATWPVQARMLTQSLRQAMRSGAPALEAVG